MRGLPVAIWQREWRALRERGCGGDRLGGLASIAGSTAGGAAGEPTLPEGGDGSLSEGGSGGGVIEPSAGQPAGGADVGGAPGEGGAGGESVGGLEDVASVVLNEIKADAMDNCDLTSSTFFEAATSGISSSRSEIRWSSSSPICF